MSDKISILERIFIALDRTDKSQRDLSKYMGLSHSAVNRMLSNKEIDSLKYIQAVEGLTGYRFEWLRIGRGPERVGDDSNLDDPSLEFLKDKLKTKDDLIKEQGGRIEVLEKLVFLLESQIRDLRGNVAPSLSSKQTSKERRTKAKSGKPRSLPGMSKKNR